MSGSRPVLLALVILMTPAVPAALAASKVASTWSKLEIYSPSEPIGQANKGVACTGYPIATPAVCFDPPHGPLSVCSRLSSLDLGGIPPGRACTVGTLTVSADAATALLQSGNPKNKWFRVRAEVTYPPGTTIFERVGYALARFVDPIVFADPMGSAFDVSLERGFFENEGTPGIVIGSDSDVAWATYHADVSTDRTGFLFSLDLRYHTGEPLGVDVTLGSYVSSLAGWDEGALEAALGAALDASTADDDFRLAVPAYNFPLIPIHVDAGQTLSITGEDTADVISCPEGSTWEDPDGDGIPDCATPLGMGVPATGPHGLAVLGILLMLLAGWSFQRRLRARAADADSGN